MNFHKILIVFLLFIFPLLGCNGSGISAFNQEGVTNESEDILLNHENREQFLFVRFLGIPEGEATLIQFSGVTILVDTGAPSSQEKLRDLLAELNVHRIDYLFITNKDPIYRGNLDLILENYEVDTLLYSKMIAQTIFPHTYPKKVKNQLLSKGDVIKPSKKLQIEILHPGDQLSLSPQNNSLVLRVIHDKITFLFTSGINEETEKRLAAEYELKSQFLKVSDGASNFGSYEGFLQEVDAHVAIIFEYGEEWGSDTSEVIERLEETWIEVYQIKGSGTVTVQSSGQDYAVFKER